MREIVGEAHKSETECRHKTDEVTRPCTSAGKDPQLWIQRCPVNIIQLSVGKLQVSAESNYIAVTIIIWR